MDRIPAQSLFLLAEAAAHDALRGLYSSPLLLSRVHVFEAMRLGRTCRKRRESAVAPLIPGAGCLRLLAEPITSPRGSVYGHQQRTQFVAGHPPPVRLLIHFDVRPSPGDLAGSWLM